MPNEATTSADTTGQATSGDASVAPQVVAGAEPTQVVETTATTKPEKTKPPVATKPDNPAVVTAPAALPAGPYFTVSLPGSLVAPQVVAGAADQHEAIAAFKDHFGIAAASKPFEASPCEAPEAVDIVVEPKPEAEPNGDTA